MTVTAQLIGKLGGGKPETAVVKVAGSGVYEPPAGWRKAAGVFEGRSTKDTYRVFDQSYTAYFSSVSVNGGGGRHRRLVFPECLRHDYVGAPGITHWVVV